MDLDILVGKFQKKDQLAFQQLYKMYWSNVCGVAFTIIKDQGEAEELAQDVFVKIWDKAETYNPSKGRFFTWILNITRNAAIDKLRSKSHKELKLNLPLDNFVSILERVDDKKSDRGHPLLKKSLNKLSTKCVDLIQLLYFNGYNQKEASNALEIPLGTVKSRIRNCISQLRKHLS